MSERDACINLRSLIIHSLQVCERTGAGFIPDKLGEKFGIPTFQVENILREWKNDLDSGIDPKTGSDVFFVPEDTKFPDPKIVIPSDAYVEEQILMVLSNFELTQEIFTVKQIAVLLGVSTSTVRNVLFRLGADVIQREKTHKTKMRVPEGTVFIYNPRENIVTNNLIPLRDCSLPHGGRSGSY